MVFRLEHPGDQKLYSFETVEIYTYISPQTITNDQLILSAPRTMNIMASYVLDLESSNISTIVADAFNMENPQLSPDGCKVIFSSRRSGKRQLWLYDIQQTTYDQLTDDHLMDLLLRSFDGNPMTRYMSHKIMEFKMN